MLAELLLIKFLAVAITVFDFIILIDGVKRDNLALVESFIGKTFSDDCTSRKKGEGGGVALVRKFWVAGGVATL